MAFDAGAILAKLKLDTKAFKAGLQTAKTHTKDFMGAMGKMSNLMRVGVAASFIYATKKLINFTSEGARLIDMGRAFDRLADSAGESSDAIISDVREITKSLTDQRIIQSANMLDLLGVGMENTARLTEIARAAGVALGQDVGYMLESIATGTARQSRLWLDNLGIIISVEEANEAYARSLGKTTSELTDLEKRAAFVNAVLAKGDEIIAKVGANAESASEQTGHWASSWANFFDEIKAGLGNSDIPGWLDGIATSIDKVTEAMKRHRKQGFAGGPGVRIWGPSIGERLGLQQRTHAQTYAHHPQARPPLNIPRAPGAMGAIGQQISPLPWGGLDWGEITQPGITGLEDFRTEMEMTIDVGGTLGDVIQNTFADIASGSKEAGEALLKNLGRSLGTLAGRVGSFLIQSGIGFAAIGKLNPFAAIAAGFALKAIAGMFIGGTQGAARVPEYRQPTARPVEVEDRKAGTVFYIDNFVGNRAWLESLMDELNAVSRQGGYTEVHFAS